MFIFENIINPSCSVQAAAMKTSFSSSFADVALKTITTYVFCNPVNALTLIASLFIYFTLHSLAIKFNFSSLFKATKKQGKLEPESVTLPRCISSLINSDLDLEDSDELMEEIELDLLNPHEPNIPAQSPKLMVIKSADTEEVFKEEKYDTDDSEPSASSNTNASPQFTWDIP